MHGFIDLIDQKTNTKMGGVTVGDSLGEEAIVNDKMISSNTRNEKAVATSESYLFEIDTTCFKIITQKLKENDLSLDLFTLLNFFKNQGIKKKSWRHYSLKK